MNMAVATQVQKKRVKRTDSEALWQSAERRSLHAPVVVSGVSEGRLITVTPQMFSKLDVDPLYQRGETSMVTQITRALQAGGKVLDPVTLCKRPESDKLWIIDGHQRVCAHQQLGVPFRAMLHDSDGPEAERQFFIAMNARRAVSANVIAKAWRGPIGTLLRHANESPEHPLYGRVNFTQSATDSRINASSLAGGLRCAVGLDKTAGKIDVVLSRIDMALSKRINVARAEHYLRLIGRVCPKGGLPYLVLQALGVVAFERWEKEVEMPALKVIERLKNKNWAADVVLVHKYLPVLLDAVRKVWKAQ